MSPASSRMRPRCSPNVLARLEPDDWERVLVYTYPEVAERSLRWVAVHTLHELVHHGADIDAQLLR